MPLPETLGEAHKIPVRVLNKELPLAALYRTRSIPSLYRLLEQRPLRGIEGREDRIQSVDHDLEVHSTSVGAIKRTGQPTTIVLTQHDLSTAPREVGEARG